MDRRKLIILGLGLLAVVLVGAYALSEHRGAPASTAAVGGPFQLVDVNGRATDESVLKGKWSAVFFGFTYCPDACPTTLYMLGQAEDLLGPRAKDFQAVFISVDPARDTPAKMKEYLSNDAFPKNVVGLTGTQAQTDAAAKAYRVYHAKNGEGPDYLVDHSVVTYLVSPKGRFVCALPHGLTPEQASERIKGAMRQGLNAADC